MKTKAYVKYLNRSKNLDADLELIDVFSIFSSTGKLSSSESLYLYDYLNPDQHPTLSARKNSSHNRRLAVRHLKSSFCSAYVKEQYEDLGLYLQEIIFAAAKNGLKPGQLIGEHKSSFDAGTLLNAGGWNEVVNLISQDLYRKLENEKSTKSLLDKIKVKLGLKNIEKYINDALPYLDIRHKLVHADGIADDEFVRVHPSIQVSENKKIVLDFDVMQKARTAISALVLEIDKSIVENKMLSRTDLQK